MNTQDQTRAQKAFHYVDKVAKEKGADFKKKYATQCRRLPQLIQQCGLCQTVAFLASKPNDDAMRLALGDFSNVVLESGATPEKDGAGLAERARTLPVREYQWLSRHALQCANWMKRYAEALLPTESR